MGLFGSKKVYVSSTVQNLAGKEADRPNYLKTTVIGSVLADQEGIADTLQRAYLKGPQMKLRSFYRWSQRDGTYDQIGSPDAIIGSLSNISGTVVATQIPRDDSQSVSVQTAEVGVADYSYWSEQYILENYKDRFDTEWSSDLDEATGVITITWEDESTTTFTPTMDKEATYIYAAYMVTEEGKTKETVENDPVDGEPDLEDYTLVSDVTEDDVRTRTYTKEIYLGTDEDILGGDKTLKDVYTLVWTTTDAPTSSYQVTVETIIVKEWIGPYVFIYKVGSGNAVLDALVESSEEDYNDQQFYPFIPIRLDNEFLSDNNYPDAYAQAKKAFKKSVDGDMDDVIDELSDLESLDDIDHCYAVFGVSANVVENTSRQYMYLFFKKLMDSQVTSGSDYAEWQENMAAFQESLTAWLEWRDAQDDWIGDPGDEPAVLAYPLLPKSLMTLNANGLADFKYKVEISWQTIAETSGSGLAKEDAKVGEVWFETISSDLLQDKLYFKKSLITVNSKDSDLIRMYWQKDADNWVALDILGMEHKNYIYKKKYVGITLKEALEDTEESGFIVPLHYGVVKEMSLVASTQMTTACCYLVFNSYVIKKTGLLGSIFFKILLVVVIIVVIVYAPQLAPTLANAAAATGTAVGLTGTAALVAGAAINAIAAMVISSIIMKASVAIFGDKLGLIIGTIASVVAMNAGANLLGGQGLTVNFGNMMSAANLTTLTSAVGNVVTGLLRISTMNVIEKSQALQEEYKKQMGEVEDAYADLVGYARGIIDPLALSQADNTLVESPSTFLTRTLMTGTDIAQMSMDMLTNMVDITTSNDLPLQN